MSDSMVIGVVLKCVRCPRCTVFFAIDPHFIQVTIKRNSENDIFSDNLDAAMAQESEADEDAEEKVSWVHCPNGHRFTYASERPVEKPKPRSKAERRAKIIAAHEREQAEARERDKPNPSAGDDKAA